MSTPAIPHVFISYVHYDGPTSYREPVLTLAQRLRENGIDCVVDQFFEVEPPARGFPRWMMDEVEAADFVLVVCTPTYYRRFRAHEKPGAGLGGTWEGGIITQELYDAGGQNIKFIPIGFESYDAARSSIPDPLRPTIYRNVATEDGLTMLMRQIYGEPVVVPTALGQRPTFVTSAPSPVLPATGTVTASAATTSATSVDIVRLTMVLQKLDSTSLTGVINLVPEAHRYDVPYQPVTERVAKLLSFAQGEAGPGANAIARAAVAAFPVLAPKIGSFS